MLLRRGFKTLLSDAQHVTAPLVQERFGFTTATEIQRKAYPLVTAGESVCLQSHTGSGKTLAYLLPLVERLKRTDVKDRRHARPRAIILVPSRGLVAQVTRDAKTLCRSLLSAVSVVGARRRSVDRKLLDRPIDVLVGSPGRVRKLLEEDLLFMSELEAAVVDEADTMYDKRADFSATLARIFLPVAKRAHRSGVQPQWVLSSASMNSGMRSRILHDFPSMQFLSSHRLHHLSPKLKQTFLDVAPGQDKLQLVYTALDNNAGPRTIVFCNTVPACRAVDHYLQEQGVPAACYHGQMPAKLREEEWDRFATGDARVLVATDLASRGLDTTFVDRVINFDFPRNSTDYLHRVGRTARMDAREGEVLSFVQGKDKRVVERVRADEGRALKID